MNQGNIRRWLLPGALAVASLVGTACHREEERVRREIPRTGGPYQGVANDSQPLSSFGPGTGGSGTPDIAPVQDIVGTNLPPTAVGNVPPRVEPGIAAGSPTAIQKEQQEQDAPPQGAPPAKNTTDGTSAPKPGDAPPREDSQVPH
ncbi:MULTISPECIES: hypothetical protein [Myxococcus]|uniref:Lipoprotein n=2 Tax=Myxococcus TaxID=32 RepID=A0A3S7V0G5_MYXFU|nr:MULTISPECIES: hypothetical protein [Myxococcus]AYM54487.1 hypothetical protein [Myxococcus fulvus]NTX03144.1 hypothetical protein [Myxococcus sp. CA040A]TQF16687.1 hypothetical protein FJV41_07140 [Myxococcus llanfairpwllgwyngyllgogerychwyrndrobwllllantysiliogogogochensis]